MPALPDRGRCCRFGVAGAPLLECHSICCTLVGSSPTVRHAGLVVIVGQHRELPIDDPALIIRRLHPPPIRDSILIRAGEGIHAHDLPSLGKALVLLGGPFGASVSAADLLLLSGRLFLPPRLGDGWFLCPVGPSLSGSLFGLLAGECLLFLGLGVVGVLGAVVDHVGHN